MHDPEMLDPQETPDVHTEESVPGVMLDPDGIRALLAKIKDAQAQE